MCQGLGAVSQPRLCPSLPGDSILLSLFPPPSHYLAGLLGGQHLVVAKEVLSVSLRGPGLPPAGLSFS